MAKVKKKPYRRKNRRLEFTIDIPTEYKDDEALLNSLADKMDDVDWQLQLDEDDDGVVTIVPINRIKLGDLEFDKEEE